MMLLGSGLNTDAMDKTRNETYDRLNEKAGTPDKV